MKKLIALVFVLLSAGIVAATAAFAAGSGNSNFGPETRVCPYTQEGCSGQYCPRQDGCGTNYTHRNGDGFCDYRAQGGQGRHHGWCQ